MKQKKYRVNESELFNLESMYEHLKCREDELREAPRGMVTTEMWDELYARLDEIESLMDKAYCVGALVDWQTLKRVREIKSERQWIRYNCSPAAGSSELEAGLAFDL